jgi:hypothetical protein
MYTLADRVRIFTLKGENVGQEGFYTRIGHERHRSPLSPIEYMPARCGWVSPEFNKIAEGQSFTATALWQSLMRPLRSRMHYAVLLAYTFVHQLRPAPHQHRPLPRPTVLRRRRMAVAALVKR